MKSPGMQELRTAIRELLAEELARLHDEQPAPAAARHEERVAIGDDTTLAAFVRHLGALYADPATRADIEAGRHRFRLAALPASAASPAPPAPLAGRDDGDTASIDAKLVSEREVNALAAGIRHLRVPKTTRLTPLAKDALRRRGIAITRSEP